VTKTRAKRSIVQNGNVGFPLEGGFVFSSLLCPSTSGRAASFRRGAVLDATVRRASPCWSVIWALCLVLAGVDADAACPFETPHFRVGATVPYCTHTNIQAAIDAAGSSCPTVIEITREHLYEGGFCDPTQPDGCHLAIAGKNVTLQGRADGETCYALTQCIPGPSCPAPSATTPLVTLDGGNNGSGRVLSISGGSNVNLRNLMIIRGAPGGAADGGGIDFSGSGNLNITRSTISINTAGYGAGISITGSGGTANLRLQAYTLIQSNIAQQSGGGIRVEGTARLFILNDPTLITGNSAVSGYGGGIEILGPARADIGSAGYNGVGVVSGNGGTYGAGIAVIDNGNGEAVLRTFADATARPTVIEDNSGATSGGGIYLNEHADACLFATRVAGNGAEDGAAIYYTRLVDVDHGSGGSGIYINSGWPIDTLGTECGPEPVSALGGSTDCRPYDAQCNAVASNITKHPDGSPSAGATIYNAGGDTKATRIRITGNVAATMFRTSYFGEVDVVRCLITDNSTSGNLVDVFGQPVNFRACTVANNVIGGDTVFDLNNSWGAGLSYHIVDQPGKHSASWTSDGVGTFDASYLMTNDKTGLPQDNPSIVTGTPAFVDAANGDYHLAPVNQPALDFGPDSIDYDLDGGVPKVDLVTQADVFGTADLGAYERQNLFYNCGTYDSVFCDGFDH
jgi:hypothetical protein